MGKIHVLSEHVANKIAAGEVVERPASVLKELLENSLDAGATRVKVQVEGGGRKLIQVTDNGCGMMRDDALLAFERHATSKIKDAEDLLNIDTLGFRGEALPSIAAVSRVSLETRAAEEESGTIVEIAGGKILKVEEQGLPAGTSMAVRDLFFNTPARKKFLKAESTELSHIASLVTHYALAHPEKHFELHSSANALLIAAPVQSHSDRIYQILGKETLDQLIAVTASMKLERAGIPEPPPWRRDEQYQKPEPGEMRVKGFVSKPEIQKLNRNSIFVFVNGRLVRDKTIQHALTEAYRNILPPTVYPVVLLFIDLPNEEVDANVHPAKTEVRFRQQGVVHDFVRDSVRSALMKARPVPQFTREITAQPNAAPGFSPGSRPRTPGTDAEDPFLQPGVRDEFLLQPQPQTPRSERLQFAGTPIPVEANTSVSGFGPAGGPMLSGVVAADDPCGNLLPAEEDGPQTEVSVALDGLKPLGQIRESFILAVNAEGLWIIDQHVAHERVLFEKVLRARGEKPVEGQRLLMPLIIELSPGQQAVFAEIAEELRRNGFEAELFGVRTIAIKTAPAGVQPNDVEKMLIELLDQFEKETQVLNLEKVRAKIAASIACHAAIKINMPLDQNKMEWLLAELAKTECPMTCPHGRPVVLRYSVKEIQRAFKRI
ncbi:MAG TPA: DNA mismatch repair endonuclease MutL [Candidatus Saccharimonadales bacterium]|jgi:DNA mismatch repair protein MutL|nr:DNA mismatch repair endonuclease MutL [Candidatus Saccharimonadales bacterium]